MPESIAANIAKIQKLRATNQQHSGSITAKDTMAEVRQHVQEHGNLDLPKNGK
jgi:hypothetical protein